MDRKKFWSSFLLGSMLIAVFVILWNGSTTIPAIWRTLSSILYPIIGGIAIAFIMKALFPLVFIQENLGILMVMSSIYLINITYYFLQKEREENIG